MLILHLYVAKINYQIKVGWRKSIIKSLLPTASDELKYIFLHFVVNCHFSSFFLSKIEHLTSEKAVETMFLD